MVLGADGMDALRRSHVAVFGLGGVGSYAVEALVRSGVGELTLIDDDTVALTNLNRQLEALHSTLGQSKAEAIAARCRDINPAVVLHPIVGRYEAAGRERFFDAKYDYILDCIDLVSCKLDLIETALARGIPILSALGTGNKLDPSQLQITDISKTYGCPLARVMRKELKARGMRKIIVLNVAGAFHSRLMKPAGEALEKVLEESPVAMPRIPVYHNFTAAPAADVAQLRANLAAQVAGSVRWEECVRNMVAAGGDTMIEFGPGNVLTGLLRRTLPEVRGLNVNSAETLRNIEL